MRKKTMRCLTRLHFDPALEYLQKHSRSRNNRNFDTKSMFFGFNPLFDCAYEFGRRRPARFLCASDITVYL